MAGDSNQDDRTEEATPERREDFREKGQVAVSKDISATLALSAVVLFMTYFSGQALDRINRMIARSFSAARTFRVSDGSVGPYLNAAWNDMLMLMIPVFAVTAATAILITLLQSQFNWSWKKIAPDFNRMDPLKGLARMVSVQALVETLKAIAKIGVIGLLAFLILKSEWGRVPTLMRVPIQNIWAYWGDITTSLFFAVSGLLIVIGGFDYLYNFISFERQMKMTKQEVKEEYKRRELDPQVKNRLRRMQRDLVLRKVVDRTKRATVLVTNPTHYSIAIKYEIGMGAPIVLAKGMDYVALRMREVAKENDIPIVENRPLARTLYKICTEDQEIPASLFVAVSEVIRYVFNLKGIRINRTKTAKKAA